jgi:hypothetical protein
MVIFYDAQVPPEAQTAFVREVPVDAGRALLAAIPERHLTTNTVNWAELTRTNRTEKFRAFDGAIAKSKRDSASESQVRLLPLGSSLDMGEYERLQLEFARTGGTNSALLADAIYNDSEILTNEVLNRLEMAWGDVLTDGKLTINENGYQGEADFGVPANQIVAPATLWSNIAASVPLTNLIAWHDVYVANGNPAAGAIRTSNAVLRLVLSNAQIINAVHGSAAGRTHVTLPELNALLASYGLPPFVAPFDEQLNVDDVNTRVIAADKVLITPASLGDLGYTAYGVSATALELVQSAKADFSFEEASGIVGVVVKDGPPFRQTTFVDAVAMPILSNAKALMVADVVA